MAVPGIDERRAVIGGFLLQFSTQDTVHDFWNGGRGTYVLNEAELVTLRNAINTIANEDIAGFTNNLIHTTVQDRVIRWINKPTSYDRSIVEQVEQDNPSHLFADTKQTITYDEILADGAGVLKAKYDGNRDECSILSIVTGARLFDTFSPAEKNTIANFIMTYMFGDAVVRTPGQTFGITLDAGPVAVRKVFADIEQMYNYIYPQTIADSASTSFKSKKNRFIFPPDSLFRSNAFTEGRGIRIVFQDKGYSALNPYGFDLVLVDAAGAEIGRIPFSSSQTDGASVNYLVKTFLAATSGADLPPPEISKMLNLTTIQAVIGANPTILFDIKRSGDFEQTHAALQDPEVIFATIDHLSSLYARLLHKQCIWSNNESSEMILYRFDLVPPTPEAVHFRKYAFFAKESLTRAQYLTNAEETRDDVNAAIAEFTKGARGYYLTKTKIPRSADEQQSLLTFISKPDFAVLDPTRWADVITTAFLRGKCSDVVIFLTTDIVPKIEAALAQFAAVLPGLAEVEAQMKSFADNTGLYESVPAEEGGFVIVDKATGAPLGIEPMLDAVKTALDTMSEVIDIQIKNGKFYVPMFEDAGAIFLYKHNTSNPSVGLSNGDLKSIHNAISAVIGVALSTRGGRGKVANVTLFLSNYSDARTTFLNTFKEDTSELISRATVNMTGLEVITEPDIPKVGGKVLEMIAALAEYYNALPTAGGFRILQAGGDIGNPIVHQTIDLEFLFRDICARAATHVESVISEVLIANGIGAVNDADAVMSLTDIYTALGISSTTQDVAHDIAVLWETELAKIREGALDNYNENYKETLSTLFVTVLLAHHTDENGKMVQNTSMKNTPILRRDEVALRPFLTELEKNYLLVAGDAVAFPFFGESRALLALTIFDNMMNGENKPDQYFRAFTPKNNVRYGPFTYTSPAQWDELLFVEIDTVVTAATTGKTGYKRGGRRPLYRVTSP